MLYKIIMKQKVLLEKLLQKHEIVMKRLIAAIHRRVEGEIWKRRMRLKSVT